MTFTCPCCGSPLAQPPEPESLLYADMGPIAKRAVKFLLTIYPHTISRQELANIVYQDDLEGGPVWANGSLGVLLHKANKDIKSSGWRIGSSARGRKDGIGLRKLA